jgi:hypothetical protein
MEERDCNNLKKINKINAADPDTFPTQASRIHEV